MKSTQLRNLIREEIRRVIKESIYVGQTVKVKTPGMTHYNKIGEVVEQDSQGKFFTVEFPTKGNQVELAYYHISDLKATLPQEGIVKESHSNQQNYMFFQNLHTINRMTEKMLALDAMRVDQLLSDGHAWAVDHIATSADDVTEVGQWLCNEMKK